MRLLRWVRPKKQYGRTVSGVPNPDSPRLTQEERRTRMRRRLLEAAVACLREKGYAETTVTEVQERAGVARGTLLHHFPAKAELMVAATEHLALRRIERFRTEAARIP